MASASSSVTINKPVDQVFSYVVDVANHPSWQAGILEARVTPDGPVGVGSTYHYTTEVMGNRMETQMQVTAFEENKTWGVTTVGVPRPVETIYSFEAAGDATTLTVSMDLPPDAYPAAALDMVKQQMAKAMADAANKIKTMIEG
jgi:uncharacterized protein YndB with AHSA1/START domain